MLAFIVLLALGGGACSKSKSYSELLRDEEKAVNWYLAGQKVELELPKDSISFLTGEDAPFYKMDEDGTVYMKVISKGEMNADGKPAKIVAGDQVYFRFERTNILFLYEGLGEVTSGNSNNLVDGASYFFYKNTTFPNSVSWGTGIQVPMKFFGYDSEVNLILKSRSGFQSDQLNCYPYVINVRYFKPEY